MFVRFAPCRHCPGSRAFLVTANKGQTKKGNTKNGRNHHRRQFGSSGPRRDSGDPDRLRHAHPHDRRSGPDSHPGPADLRRRRRDRTVLDPKPANRQAFTELAEAA
jgi:hypothetical protein